MKVFGGRYLDSDELRALGLGRVGEGVLVHESAQLVDLENITIGDNCRIDAFTVISAAGGSVELGSHIHIAGSAAIFGAAGVSIGDFAGLSGGVKIYSASDDYTGRTLTNPTIPDRYKKVTKAFTAIGAHCIVGAGSIVLPGANLGEGVAVGALSVVTKPQEPWTVCMGYPAKPIKRRKQDMLQLAEQFLAERAAQKST